MKRDAAASAQAGQGTGPLSAELAAFVQSGITVLIGASDLHGTPVAGFGFSCTVDAAAGELRVLVDPAGSAPLLAAVRAGGSVAASFTDLEHRSIQAKGARARIEAPTPRDLADYARQSRGHRDWLALAGFAPAFCTGFVRCDPQTAVVVVFAPEQAFRQTPGPGAGEAIHAFPDPLGRAERSA
ncbi:hypothetical protein [Albimonas pacifica]|uniref:Pyridoxamine 5'-phosphate oxidase putative domain-containing protein n=1 Tax=Albimonas pacifica TaxID=1114924 RepID=A0A1I3EGX3_9RHOB|nr:hypothetical protein [Albimonas pacifica]SFH98255.1 hypothetical protein SAMN05216258_103374 [Albimonas pacifica]